jgi:hypothetical protein
MQMANIKSLQKRLHKIESQLEKVRGASPLTYGWQTQKLAKAQRKWDELAKTKAELLKQIEEAEWDDFCDKTRMAFTACQICHAFFEEECVCE